MKRFNQTGLWTMLRNPDHAGNGSAEADAALDEFVTEIQDYCRQEKDLAERTRTLRFSQTELAALGNHLRFELGKKCAVADCRRPSY